MTRPKNAMEVFKLLKKNNCRDCDEPTCLAFAAAVFKGQKKLSQCPHIDPQTMEKYGGELSPAENEQGAVSDMEAQLEQLKLQLQNVDLAAAAQRLGGRFSNAKLIVKVMGKDLGVDAAGRLSSDIHIHGWIALPFFHYVIRGQGAPLTNQWVPLRELENGKDWAQFFSHRCEKPLKQVADTYTDLFEDMVHLFNGKPVEQHYQADISLVLHPFPKLPVLICYWKPEEGLASSLNIFFDAHAEKNLPIESIYVLATGLVQMFQKIALRHGVPQSQ
jgi:hypothetical protein